MGQSRTCSKLILNHKNYNIFSSNVYIYIYPCIPISLTFLNAKWNVFEVLKFKTFLVRRFFYIF